MYKSAKELFTESLETKYESLLELEILIKAFDINFSLETTAIDACRKDIEEYVDAKVFSKSLRLVETRKALDALYNLWVWQENLEEDWLPEDFYEDTTRALYGLLGRIKESEEEGGVKDA